MTVPGIAVGCPSSFVIESAATGVILPSSVAALFDESGSVMPAGGWIVAVLTSVPVAVALRIPDTTYVTAPLAGRSATVPIALPLPLASWHTAPPAPVHVHVIPISAAGKVSAIVAPTMLRGP